MKKIKTLYRYKITLNGETDPAFYVETNDQTPNPFPLGEQFMIDYGFDEQAVNYTITSESFIEPADDQKHTPENALTKEQKELKLETDRLHRGRFESKFNYLKKEISETKAALNLKLLKINTDLTSQIRKTQSETKTDQARFFELSRQHTDDQCLDVKRFHSEEMSPVKRKIKQYMHNGSKVSGVHTTTGGSSTEEIASYGVSDQQACHVSVHTEGASPVTIKSSRCEKNKLVVELSADPSTDHKFNYTIY